MLFGTEEIEFRILETIHNAIGGRSMDFLMTAISALGNGGFLWILTAVAMMISKKYRKTGVVMAAGLVLGLIFGNVILKNLAARPRPCWIFEVPHILVTVPDDYSFPSGHTISSFVSALVIFDANRHWGIGALIVACVMAFSRMYLFVHFPTDILGGMVLASVIWLVVRKLFRKVNIKKN